MPRVIVNEERCKGCGYCATACKRKVIKMHPEKRNRAGYLVAAFGEEQDCAGCAMCALVCPDVALEVC